ncbi:ABC transporter permease [Halanaerobiaceae bacterium Z-7014]|uniref:ABC transporter permease n=1 Tax=Halonatronomonas betaini TaxID=2778430 RepID=A0A931AN81_9FIRM|nr:ABC transporter permease [Halonatronomonas betaini]MBF8435832.1 ABC transporter permease [Halonatronomonas betaini]
MTAFLVLFFGEMQRMQKYHILTASILVSFFWIGMLHLVEVPDITAFFMILVFFDIVSMAIVMIGVTIFFEKQEGVLKSIFVSPINRLEFISSKTIANLISNIITIAIVYLYARIVQDININLAGLFFAIILIGTFHSLVGFLIVYRSNDFTEMLIGMMKYFIVFMLPVAFEEFGLITAELYSNLLFLLPTKSSSILITATAGGLATGEVVLATIYLLAGSLVLAYFVNKGFRKFVIRESGV